MKRIFSYILILSVLAPIWAWAGKSSGPSAADQQAFTDQYNQAKASGPDALSQFQHQITNQGTADQNTMLNNLDQGKTADGKAAAPPPPPAGFHGDPTDKGPTDWSNYDIQTDANGNITGFKLKDADQIDTDHDGKISDDELAAWNKKKDEENKKNGGPPGFRPQPNPPGVGNDGKPKPGLGCCLVRRHAVETLWNAHPELAYVREYTVDKPGRALFTHGVGRASDGKTRMIGEDQAFLDRCRAAGFEVKSLKENICHDGVWNMTKKATVQEQVTEPQERIYALPEPAKLALRELLAGQAAAQQRVVDFGRAAALMLGLDPNDPTMRFDAVNGAFVVPGK